MSLCDLARSDKNGGVCARSSCEVQKVKTVREAHCKEPFRTNRVGVEEEILFYLTRLAPLTIQF